MYSIKCTTTNKARHHAIIQSPMKLSLNNSAFHPHRKCTVIVLSSPVPFRSVQCGHKERFKLTECIRLTRWMPVASQLTISTKHTVSFIFIYSIISFKIFVLTVWIDTSTHANEKTHALTQEKIKCGYMIAFLRKTGRRKTKRRNSTTTLKGEVPHNLSCSCHWKMIVQMKEQIRLRE